MTAGTMPLPEVPLVRVDFFLAGGQLFGVTVSERDAEKFRATYEAYLEGSSLTAMARFPEVGRSDGTVSEVTINMALVVMLHVTPLSG